jgi:adenylate kinase family enzyme
MAKPVLMIITGQPGSGKTTLARKFAAKLPVPTLTIATEDGYQPGLAEIVRFFLALPRL